MHQQATATATMAFPSLPASPTLTNPDMILPYGEYDSTPSPPQHPLRPESPTAGWKSAIPDDMSFSLGPPGHIQMGVGPMTPATPIIYGNGTMLSDIGEVTEAESTPGRKPRQTHSRLRDRDSPLTSSPTMGYEVVSKRSKMAIHHRSVSVESNSTVTSEAPPADLFKDFDDGVSVDDSNFQGDDEESVMDDNYEEELQVAQAKVMTRKESRLIESDDMNSSAALSRRAEMILANAKKRLDNMEGNLTRARSSLYITPSSSMSSIHSSSPLSRSTPSPSDADRRIVGGLGVPPARHRQTNNAAVSPTSPGHMRVFSENSIPSSLHTVPRTSRSPGAALPSPVSVDPEHKETIPPAYTSPLSRISNNYVAPLEPLSEDEAAQDQDWDHESMRASTADPYSTRPGDYKVLTRSTSSMQMRDLTDKMKDLKGKISTLRDRAREDNMKRRSLQSLRTPSPFTAAEQWYTSSKAYNGGVAVNGDAAHSPWNGEPSVTESLDGGDERNVEHSTVEEPKEEGSEGPSVYQDVNEGELEHPESGLVDNEALESTPEPEDTYDTASEREGEDPLHEGRAKEGDEDYADDFGPDELEEYQSESDASQYHDSLVTPISHEDREDAFDYEHFFLHSAMGTISQQRLGRRNSMGSLDSFSSEDSVETTRGPEAPVTVLNGDEVANEMAARGHVRAQKSTDSVSTLASFATATEGRRSIEGFDGDDDYVRDYTIQTITVPPPEEIPTTVIVKRTTFGKSAPTMVEYPSSAPKSPPLQDSSRSDSRPNSAPLDSFTQSPKLSHNSFSSFASTGTARSFPLVNRPKTSASERTSAILAEAMRGIVNGTGASSSSSSSPDGGETKERKEISPVDMLAREDQILVERIVASVGRCVLGLQEAGRASSEGRMWRRRLDSAWRLLEDGA